MTKLQKNSKRISFQDIWNDDGLSNRELALAVALLFKHWFDRQTIGNTSEESLIDVQKEAMELLARLLDTGGVEMRRQLIAWKREAGQ